MWGTGPGQDSPHVLLQCRWLDAPERGFLCKLLPLPLYRPPADPGLDLELVSEFVQAAAAGPVICATDGGAFTRPKLVHWQRAAWALAVATVNGQVVVGGLVTTFEQTLMAAPASPSTCRCACLCFP